MRSIVSRNLNAELCTISSENKSEGCSTYTLVSVVTRWPEISPHVKAIGTGVASESSVKFLVASLRKVLLRTRILQTVRTCSRCRLIMKSRNRMSEMEDALQGVPEKTLSGDTSAALTNTDVHAGLDSNARSL